jgi:apolipoprotein N-acyltransferase
MNGIEACVTRAGGSSLAGQPFGGSFIDRLYGRCLFFNGWQRCLAAGFLGAVAVLALPPLFVLPALIVAFSGLIWLIDGAPSLRASALVGYVFGLGYFTAGLYWVANALLTKLEEFGWLAPLAPLALAFILAPFFVVPVVLARGATRCPGVSRILIFAAAWTIAEWLRSWVLTGFPWNLIGSVWSFSAATLQASAWVGTYGLSFVTVIAAAMPALLAPRLAGLGRRWVAPIVAMVGLVLVLGAGAIRLAAAEATGVVDGVRLRLVQPNIDQSLKWRRDLLDQHLAEQARLGATPADPPPTHILWSEVAAPMFVAEDPARVRLIARHTPPGGLTILGTLRRSGNGETLDLWNSVIAVDAGGHIVGSYDKSHLVPFGEYMPLRAITNIGNFTLGFADFSAGPGITTNVWPGLPPVSPLICYEVIFPAAVARRDDRPQWLLNLTNDGWYGNSAGPYQHFAAARLRAVEEGLPMVRVANTGISAIIDPYGRVLQHLDFGRKGVLDGDLPRPLSSATLYAQTGNLPILLVAVAVLLVTAVVERRKYPLSGEK